MVVVLCHAVQAVFVLLSVVFLGAKSVAAVDIVMLAVVLVMPLGIVVLLVVVVAATFYLCRVRSPSYCVREVRWMLEG